MNKKSKEEIVEKKLGIPPDYQYKAIRSKNILQKNWHRNKWEVLQNYIEFKPNMRVLDLGTGSGNFELEFADKVKGIVGVDYNDEALTFLQKKLDKNKIKNVKLIQMDVRDEKISQLGKFDLIIMVDVIEHIKISDAKKLVRKMRNLLKSGGIVCIITPNYHSFWVLIEKVLDILTVIPKFDEEQHLAKYYRNNLIRLFRDANFELKSVSSFNLFSYVYPVDFLSQYVLRFELLMPVILGNLLVGTFRLPDKVSKKTKKRF